jgi:NosR/NirI family nitrous oxide reductase transcriptional regulator
MRLPILQPSAGSAPATVSPNAAKPNGQRWSNWRDSSWHTLRILLLIFLVLGLHRWSAKRDAQRRVPVVQSHLLSLIQRTFPLATGLKQTSNNGLLEVVDSEGNPLGAAVTTSPQADQVVGYAGPNNVLLVLSNDQTIVAAHFLSSSDTEDHVALVKDSQAFWQQFVGRTWNNPNPAAVPPIDGVSGATLTSLAIAESIVMRMSGQKLNLRFPKSPTLDEVQALVPEAMSFEATTWHGHEAWQILGTGGAELGRLIRTGNLIDSLDGYQGPTELLLWFDADDVLRNVRLRSSYDNQPYVGYVQQEYSFWPMFKQRDLASLASIDLEQEKIEGVSGATMTSLAVAQTLQAAAARLLEHPATSSSINQPVPPRDWNWSLTELATAALAVASIPWSRGRWRGARWPRWVWQLTCFSVLGIAAGNLLSLALFAGWTRGGIPFHLAPGLVTLLAVALVWPAVSKSNVYCDQMCPHGIVQQWILPWRRPAAQALWGLSPTAPRAISVMPSPWKRAIVHSLQWTSFAGIAAACGWLLFDWPVALAVLEPFDTYAWRVGWSFSCLVWGASLVAAVWRPMAYCQLACPTGRLLDLLRRSRRRPGSWWLEIGLLLAVALVWCT